MVSTNNGVKSAVEGNRAIEIGLLAGITTAVLCLWVLPARHSLNIDETVTFWSTIGDYSELTRKVTAYQNQSPLYYYLLKLASFALGNSELALRSVSLLASLGSAFLVFCLGRKAAGRRAGFLAAFFFVMLPPVVTAATTARSYAVAILLSLSASFAFWVWLESQRNKHLALYALFFALSVYAHFLFAAAAFMHLLWLLFTSGGRTARHLLRFFLALCVSALLLLPAAAQFRSIQSRQAVLSYSGIPTVVDLLFTLVPQGLVLSFGLAMIFAMFESRDRADATKRIGSRDLIRWLIWWIAPATICFAVSQLSSSQIFIERYFSWGVPAFALLMGAAIAAFPAARGDAAAAIAFAIAQLFVLHETYRGAEDWSGAIAQLRKLDQSADRPVLAYTGLVEARDTNWLQGEKREYVLAPFSYYSSPAAVHALPASCAQGPDKEYFDTIVMPALQSSPKLALLVRMTRLGNGSGAELSDEHFLNCLKERGYALEQTYSFDHVALLLLSKVPG